MKDIILIATNLMAIDYINKLLGISNCNIGILETTFFSDDNINIINKYLIKNVFLKSNKLYKINPQSADSVIIVMYYIYAEHSKFLPNDLFSQLYTLNNLVINELTSTIITNLTQHTDFIRDISMPLNPPPPPINSSIPKTLKPTIQFTN